MSFGFSVSDFIVLTQLAYTTIQNSCKACGAHNELTQEVTSLHTVLQRLQREVEKPQSLLNRTKDGRLEELQTIMKGCDRILKVIDQVLVKYNGMTEEKRRVTRFRLKVKFGNGEMKDIGKIRHELSTYTSAITLFLNLLSMGSLGQVEEHMENHGEELRELRQSLNWITASLQASSGNREGSILTSYADDDKAIWKEFRRELVKEGFSSSELRRHKSIIKDYVMELGARGALDVPEMEEPTAGVEVGESTVRQESSVIDEVTLVEDSAAGEESDVVGSGSEEGEGAEIENPSRPTEAHILTSSDALNVAGLEVVKDHDAIYGSTIPKEEPLLLPTDDSIQQTQLAISKCQSTLNEAPTDVDSSEDEESEDGEQVELVVSDNNREVSNELDQHKLPFEVDSESENVSEVPSLIQSSLSPAPLPLMIPFFNSPDEAATSRNAPLNSPEPCIPITETSSSMGREFVAPNIIPGSNPSTLNEMEDTDQDETSDDESTSAADASSTDEEELHEEAESPENGANLPAEIDAPPKDELSGPPSKQFVLLSLAANNLPTPPKPVSIEEVLDEDFEVGAHSNCEVVDDETGDDPGNGDDISIPAYMSDTEPGRLRRPRSPNNYDHEINERRRQERLDRALAERLQKAAVSDGDEDFMNQDYMRAGRDIFPSKFEQATAVAKHLAGVAQARGGATLEDHGVLIDHSSGKDEPNTPSIVFQLTHDALKTHLARLATQNSGSQAPDGLTATVPLCPWPAPSEATLGASSMSSDTSLSYVEDGSPPGIRIMKETLAKVPEAFIHPIDEYARIGSAFGSHLRKRSQSTEALNESSIHFMDASMFRKLSNKGKEYAQSTGYYPFEPSPAKTPDFYPFPPPPSPRSKRGEPTRFETQVYPSDSPPLQRAATFAAGDPRSASGGRLKQQVYTDSDSDSDTPVHRSPYYGEACYGDTAPGRTRYLIDSGRRVPARTHRKAYTVVTARPRRAPLRDPSEGPRYVDDNGRSFPVRPKTPSPRGRTPYNVNDDPIKPGEDVPRRYIIDNGRSVPITQRNTNTFARPASDNPSINNGASYLVDESGRVTTMAKSESPLPMDTETHRTLGCRVYKKI